MNSIIETKALKLWLSLIHISKEKADLTDTSNRKKFDEMSAHKQYDSLKRKQKHYCLLYTSCIEQLPLPNCP